MRIEDKSTLHISLDSSVLIGFYHVYDSLHTKAEQVMKKYSEKDSLFLLHPLVFIESLTILKRKINIEALEFCESEFLDTEKFTPLDSPLSPSQLNRALPIFNGNRDLSLTDAVLLDLSLAKNYELLTFDKNLEKVYRKLKKK